MGRGPEGKIQDKVLKYVKFRDLLYKKQEVGRYFVSSGWPDVAIYPGKGRVFFIEFKAPGGRLTPLQAHAKKEIEARGYMYYLIDDAVKGKMIIDFECGQEGQ